MKSWHNMNKGINLTETMSISCVSTCHASFKSFSFLSTIHPYDDWCSAKLHAASENLGINSLRTVTSLLHVSRLLSAKVFCLRGGGESPTPGFWKSNSKCNFCIEVLQISHIKYSVLWNDKKQRHTLFATLCNATNMYTYCINKFKYKMTTLPFYIYMYSWNGQNIG